MESGTARLAGKEHSTKTGLAAWQAAWQHLGDNPLAQYLVLAEQRRNARGRRRRTWSYLLLILASGALWVMFIVANTVQSSYFDWREASGWCFSYICLLYIIWLAECIFNTVRDALLVLAPPSKLTTSLALDDTLAATALGDEDIVLGVLRILLPPLWMRGLVGSILLWLGVLLVASEGMAGWSKAAEQLLVLMPLGVALTALSSLLGGIAFILFYLAASQTHNTMAVSGAAVIATIWQLSWIILGPVIAIGELQVLSDFEGVDQAAALGIGLAGLALCLGLICAAAARARYLPAARVLNAVLGPWLLPAFIVFLFTIWQITIGLFEYVGSEEAFGVFIIGYLQGSGCILPLNAGAIFSSMFTGIIEAEPEMYWQLLRIPGTLLLQVVLVAMMAWAARDSVRRRRTFGALAQG